MANTSNLKAQVLQERRDLTDRIEAKLKQTLARIKALEEELLDDEEEKTKQTPSD